MAELLPTLQAREIRRSLTDYLATTFALTDPAASGALGDFLSDEDHGLFRGPFLRLRMPFGAAPAGWEDSLGVTPRFPPYGHQARAFERLSSRNLADGERPGATLITTGTGSGKTEAFLYPILDHVRRAKLEGVTGTKALILYPMNALANDQAGRITELVKSIPGLAGVTVGLYTGQASAAAASIASGSLITEREFLRKNAPDILLTNYKMLDQLLLRPADQEIWKQSALSLQYLVLDEFHTYDGAQGTDVAMLLRRLGLALKSHWPSDAAAAEGLGIHAEDWSNPLGKITPVATSATLGDKGDPAQMLSFARTVFGVEFEPDAVVTESRVPVEEWTGSNTVHLAGAEGEPTGTTAMAKPTAEIQVLQLNDRVGEYLAQHGRPVDSHTQELTARVLAHLFTLIDSSGNLLGYEQAVQVFGGVDASELLALERALPFAGDLIRATESAASLRDIAKIVFPHKPVRPTDGVTRRTRDEHFAGDPRDDAIEYIIAALSHIRAVAGREALTVELHMWVRELSRVNRVVGIGPSFRWNDDGILHADENDEDSGYALPALYCRHCGRSGWQVLLAPTGADLDSNDDAIRKEAASNNNRIRPLLYAQGEADSAREGNDVPGLHWFDTQLRSLTASKPSVQGDASEETILPVLTYTDIDANEKSVEDVCPNCERKDALRPMGSRIATLLSVTLSTMFGDQYVDAGEKKALVFTDSVQDAAHRAGFVQARSHALTLRAAINRSIGAAPATLPDLVDKVVADSLHSSHERYRLVPPDYVERTGFHGFWSAASPEKVKSKDVEMVRRRLLFDAMLEFGAQHTLGRTLELTGTARAHVQVPDAVDLLAVGRVALEGYGQSSTLDESLTDEIFPAEQVTQWIAGVLHRMRSDGAIYHDWLKKYVESDGMRIWIWGKRPKNQGMPAFPAGRPGFGFPRVGTPLPKKTESDFAQVNNAKSWYATWTAQTLHMEPFSASNLVTKLFRELAKAGAITQYTSDSGAYIYALQPEQVLIGSVPVSDLDTAPLRVVCSVCSAITPGSAATVAALENGPCLLPRCTGVLVAKSIEQNFYRTLYSSADMRRIVAREHTSLLDDEQRLEYENGFKSSSQSAGDPNVLVATPTLEMGIDIGDLSAVMLASLPRTVASYIQRVGRAGRQTGNALDLAFVSGRGENLGKIEDPLSVINGAVRAPATYLAADEILRRQYLASVIDRIARTGSVNMPRDAYKVFEKQGNATPFLEQLVDYAEKHADEMVADFVSQFAGAGVPHFDEAAQNLTVWAGANLKDTKPAGAGDGAESGDRIVENHDGGSGLAYEVYGAAQRWNTQRDSIKHRLDDIDAVKDEVKKRAEVPGASDDDVSAWSSLRGEEKLLLAKKAHMRSQYWIAALEEYGLLPNYTLLDDSVDLDVAIRWRNPITSDFETDEMTLTRSASNAIREFVPGATFYARGYRTQIQSIDLGMNGSEVTERAFCDSCGYSELIVVDKPRSMVCPRCASTGIADTGQILKVVELKKVSAEISRDESMISDSTDDREKPFFTLRTLADIDATGGNVAAQWYITDHEFGVRYLRRVTLTQLNLGKSRTNGAEMLLAGGLEKTPLFAVCEYCGKLDSASNRNSVRDHRAWCVHRKDYEEHNVHIAISRTLHTQGLVLRLPAAYTLGDDTAVPSLTAAVFLGLREHIGGEPDHLGVISVVDPIGGDPSKNRTALLIHDLVPGGTGYLADLADSQQLRSILLKAYRVVSTCDCDSTRTLACSNCLLPHAQMGKMNQVSKETAIKILRELLNETTEQDSKDEPDEAAHWQVTEEVTVIQTGESHLEAQFRAAFTEMVTSRGGKLTKTYTPGGTQLNFSLANSAVHWKLRPQVPLGHTTPDFILEANNPNLPKIAIYTDGYTFHATQTYSNIADDAQKRNVLRDMGYVVMAVTSQDLGENAGAYAPAWLQENLMPTIGLLLGSQADSSVYKAIDQGAMSMLWYFISSESAESLARAATIGAFMWTMASGLKSVATQRGGGSLEALAGELLGKSINDGTFTGAIAAAGWAEGEYTLTAHQESDNFHLVQVLSTANAGGPHIQMRSLVVHDDTDAAMASAGHRDSWRAWLRTSNILTWGTHGYSMATATMIAGKAGMVASAPVLKPVSAIEANWNLDQLGLEPGELAVLLELASIVENQPELAGTIRADLEVGAESDSGATIDLAWPNSKVAFMVDRDQDELNEIRDEGWTVFTEETEDLAQQLIAAITQNGAH